MEGTRRAGAAEGRVHLLDGAALVLAAVAAVVAYTYLFRNAPVPAVVDPILGAEITVEFRADKPWKASFPAEGTLVFLEDYLEADVTGAETNGETRVVRLRVRGRDLQTPDALTAFRSGVRRGTSLRVTDRKDEVRAEVLDVRKPAAQR
jgi:hypothetical protein